MGVYKGDLTPASLEGKTLWLRTHSAGWRVMGYGSRMIRLRSVYAGNARTKAEAWEDIRDHIAQGWLIVED